MQGPMEPRIINGVEIVFGTRSECDVPSWECPHCHQKMETIRFLVFDFPPLYCVGCKSMNPNNFSLNLATVLMNGISIVGEVKEQKIKEGDPGECVAYAVAQLAEMMNRIVIACSAEEPVLSAANTYCVPEHFISRFAEEFPDRTTGGGVHKILRMLSMLLAGVPMKSMSTKSVSHHFTGGEIRAIHCDDFEEVCRQIADGNAVLATFYDGVGYAQLQYCQYYTAMPASVVARLLADGEHVSAHVVVLVGVISEQGHRAYFALDSAGTAFCRQVGSTEGWRSLFNWNKKSQLGGYGKITADSAWYTNFFKVSRQNDHGLPPKLFVANHDPDDYIVDNMPTDLIFAPQEERDDMLATRNQRYAFHGRYLRRRFRQLRY